DSTDYSCAYDSVFGVLYSLWLDNTAIRSRQFTDLSAELAILVNGFRETLAGISSLETVRDAVRKMVHLRQPSSFPYGPNYASVDLLSQYILPDSSCGRATTICTRCNYRQQGSITTLGHHLTVSPSTSLARSDSFISLRMWFNEHFPKQVHRCPSCFADDKMTAKMLRATVVSAVPSILFLFISNVKIHLDPFIQFVCNGSSVRLYLRGLVYHSNAHFTSRIISVQGDIWFHDGIVTRNSSVYDGNIRDLPSLAGLHHRNSHNLVLAMYALEA
ncbi:hypothetical protein C8J57DRAFT_1069882, partial [Mycena rebaudengoi]